MASCLCLGAIGATAAYADGDAWYCRQGERVREVTIYYPQAPERVPCEVYYTKRDQKRMPRVLWSATREVGYCERRAAAFVDRLQALGWQCSEAAVEDTQR